MTRISRVSPRNRESLRRLRIKFGTVIAWFGRFYYRRRNVGSGTIIDRSVQVIGWRSITIGQFCVVGEDTWLNVNLPSTDDEPRLTIGNYSLIGRRNFISAGFRLSLGDYTLTGPDCHFLGADHVFDSPLQPYITTGSNTEGSIRVGANCWFGASVQVVGNVEIGHGSVIGAGSLVRQSIPPFSIAAGSPAKVLKRYDLSSQCWVKVEHFTEEMNRLIPLESAYISQMKAVAPHARLPLLARGHRAGDAL